MKEVIQTSKPNSQHSFPIHVVKWNQTSVLFVAKYLNGLRCAYNVMSEKEDYSIRMGMNWICSVEDFMCAASNHVKIFQWCFRFALIMLIFSLFMVWCRAASMSRCAMSGWNENTWHDKNVSQTLTVKVLHQSHHCIINNSFGRSSVNDLNVFFLHLLLSTSGNRLPFVFFLHRTETTFCLAHKMIVINVFQRLRWHNITKTQLIWIIIKKKWNEFGLIFVLWIHFEWSNAFSYLKFFEEQLVDCVGTGHTLGTNCALKSYMRHDYFCPKAIKTMISTCLIVLCVCIFFRFLHEIWL